MKHAITELEVIRDTLRNNIQIKEAELSLENERLSDLASAIIHLRSKYVEDLVDPSEEA